MEQAWLSTSCMRFLERSLKAHIKCLLQTHTHTHTHTHIFIAHVLLRWNHMFPKWSWLSTREDSGEVITPVIDTAERLSLSGPASTKLWASPDRQFTLRRAKRWVDFHCPFVLVSDLEKGLEAIPSAKIRVLYFTCAWKRSGRNDNQNPDYRRAFWMRRFDYIWLAIGNNYNIL